MFYKTIFFVYFFTGLCCVTSDLGLNEGASCTTDGLNGTCHNIYKCPSAALSYIYINSGYEQGYPPIPEICSYDNDDPIVCCTDCIIDETQTYRNYGVLPSGILTTNNGPVAWKKCLEYFKHLPYPCRGKGNFKVSKHWKSDKKCHTVTQQKILPVGGRKARRWEFPHMALLGYGDDQVTAQWLCGGSIISQRYILTAAHCSHAPTLGPIKYAALGLLKRTDPKKLWNIYDVKRIIKHPEYQSPIKYHDIALLETETEINFGKTLLPICLDTGKIHKYSTVEAAGWGRLGHRMDLADHLEVVNLQKFEENECASLYEPHRHLPTGYNHTSQMCYGSHNYIIDTCEGDSGGPLQVDINRKCMYFVIGVTSYGKACGVLGSAGMYTRVGHYVPWIESIVWPDEVSID